MVTLDERGQGIPNDGDKRGGERISNVTRIITNWTVISRWYKDVLPCILGDILRVLAWIMILSFIFHKGMPLKLKILPVKKWISKIEIMHICHFYWKWVMEGTFLTLPNVKKQESIRLIEDRRINESSNKSNTLTLWQTDRMTYKL